jgi:hypothetical protein
VWWSNLGSATTFTSGGKVYTLEITGFSTNCATPGTIIGEFVTQENNNNVACIYGKIVACESIAIGDPSPLTICSGGTASFSVTGPGIAYQWYKAGSPDVAQTDGTKASGATFSGSNTATLTITGVTSSEAGSYYVIVDAACNMQKKSSAALLTINPATAISTQPSSQTVCADSSVTFSVVASGSGELTYQWQQSTDGGTTWSDITGQTTSSLSLTGVIYGMNNYQYRVVVTSNVCGSAISNSAILTVNNGPMANAGSDKTVCTNVATISLTGTNAGQTASYLWTTSGTGTFSVPTALITTYTPSAADKALASITLTLTATKTSGSCRASTDSMVLYFQKNPVASAGIDQTICESATVSLTGTNAGGPATYLWTTSGTGAFSDATALSTTYTPSTADRTAGSVTITLTATGITPCSGTSADSMLISIRPTPTANAGSDQTVCKGGTVTLAGLADNYETVTWTGGAGTFVPDAHTLNAAYTPTQAEIDAGSFALTLTATAPSPCAEATDEMIVTMHGGPTAVAPGEQRICSTDASLKLTGTADSFSSLSWTIISGPGTVVQSDTNPKEATYYTAPDASVIYTETVVKFEAFGIWPCTGSVASFVTIRVDQKPSAYIEVIEP